MNKIDIDGEFFDTPRQIALGAKHRAIEAIYKRALVGVELTISIAQAQAAVIGAQPLPQDWATGGIAIPNEFRS